MKTQFCPQCETTKNVSEFYMRKDYNIPYKLCKVCSYENSKAHVKKGRKQKKAKARKITHRQPAGTHTMTPRGFAWGL